MGLRGSLCDDLYESARSLIDNIIPPTLKSLIHVAYSQSYVHPYSVIELAPEVKDD